VRMARSRWPSSRRTAVGLRGVSLMAASFRGARPAAR